MAIKAQHPSVIDSSNKQLTLASPLTTMIPPVVTSKATASQASGFIPTAIPLAQFNASDFLDTNTTSQLALAQNRATLLYQLQNTPSFAAQVNAIFTANPSLTSAWNSAIGLYAGFGTSIAPYLPALGGQSDTLFGFPKTYVYIAGAVLIFLILK